jgi:hypothetical protein
MKKKIDPERYITDALITSEYEFDYFDDQLQLQLKELAEIRYDDQPESWKRNTLAYSYLDKAERLLKEKALDDGTVRELRSLIGKYTNLKMFLLTLRLATITYRAGLIPKLTTEGASYLNRQRDKAGKPRSHDGKTPAELKTRNQEIKSAFEKKKTTDSDNAFYIRYGKKYNLSRSAIRKIVEKNPLKK